MQDIITFISQHPTLSFGILLVLILLIIVEFIRNKRRISQVSPLQMTQLINHENAVVIDIRANEAYRKGHIIDALSFTPQELRESGKKLEKFKSKPLILICQTGAESQKIAASMLKEGYNVRSLAGGMRSWIEAQMPLVKE